MTFSVRPLKLSPKDRALAVERTQRATGLNRTAATADMIREVENGRGFLLSGVRGSGKTALLNEVSLHFSSRIDNVVVLGPLSLGLVSQNGLDSLGSQLNDWLRNNATRFTLPSPYPTPVDSLRSWVPFLKTLINQRNADTLLVLLDDLDSVPPEDRETILQDIQDSSWAKLATRTVLGCAGNLREDDYANYAADELVNINLKKSCAVELLSAMVINLGMAAPGKKAEGKGGGGEYSPHGKSPVPLKYGKPGRPSGKSGKPLVAGRPKGIKPPHTEAAIRDEVEATVYAPQQASPSDSFLVQVFAELPGQEPTLEKIAKQAEPEAEKRVATTLSEKIQRGDKLTFKLDMPGLQIDQPAKSCIWRGRRELVQFNVIVPESSKPGKITGALEMWRNSAPIGDLMFSFKIVAETVAVAPKTQPVGKMKQYEYVFVSYSSKDRAEVKKFTQTWSSFGVNYFLDKMTLKSGDEWKKVIPEKIDQSDAFYLFWSTAASKSKEVRKEFRYAIKRQAKTSKSPKIYPFRIEGPPACPAPPPELADLHFEDLFS